MDIPNTNLQPPAPPVQPAQVLPAQVQAAGTHADQLLQATQPGVEVPSGPVAVPPAGDWKHKYDVLQGKYNAEIPQLQQTNSYLTTELVTTKALLNDIQQQLNGLQANPPAQAAPASLDLSKFLNDDQKKKLDEEGITNDVLNMLGQSIQGGMAQQLTNQAAGFNQEIQGLKGDQAKVEHANFWNTFETAVPDFPALNQNPAFKAFMHVPVAGTTRQRLADDAAARLDPKGVIDIYNEFKMSQPPPALQPGAQQPGMQLQPGQPGYQPELPPVPGLAGQADPASMLNVPGQNIAPVVDTKIYSKAEVNKFYSDKSIGNFNHLPDQGQAMENLIMIACQEGRVEGSLQPTR